jgi:hypothetical protein
MFRYFSKKLRRREVAVLGKVPLVFARQEHRQRLAVQLGIGERN